MSKQQRVPPTRAQPRRTRRNVVFGAVQLGFVTLDAELGVHQFVIEDESDNVVYVLQLTDEERQRPVSMLTGGVHIAPATALEH